MGILDLLCGSTTSPITSRKGQRPNVNECENYKQALDSELEHFNLFRKAISLSLNQKQISAGSTTSFPPQNDFSKKARGVNPEHHVRLKTGLEEVGIEWQGTNTSLHKCLSKYIFDCTERDG